MNINKVIVKIGDGNYILPVKNYIHHNGDEVASYILPDDSKIETGVNNAIAIFGDSDIMDAIVNYADENFNEVVYDENNTYVKRVKPSFNKQL